MKINPLLLSAIVGSILANACAAAPAPVVNNQGYPVAMEQSPNAQQTAASNKIVYDLVNRIEQLQSEVRDLTGKIEEQSYQNAEMKKRLTTMYSDFDERMQNLENKVSGGSQAAGIPAAENAGEAVQPANMDNFQPAGETST